MKAELPKSVVIIAIAVVAAIAIGVGAMFMKGSGGDLSGKVIEPKPWGGPPGGFKGMGAHAPQGAVQAKGP